MRLVVLFSGQGGQRREHLERLLTGGDPELTGPLQAAIEESGASPATLDDARLSDNAIAQPLICAYQLALWRELAPQLPRPALFSGYSLGELTAFAVAGAFGESDAVRLAAERARLMDEASDRPSGLLAVLGLDASRLVRHCAPLQAEIAIRNGPAHFIVGGTAVALEALEEAVLRDGASHSARLCVTTPSHTAVLRSAGEGFGTRLKPYLRERLAVPVLSGVGAVVVRSTTDAAGVLARQIFTPLDWAACMQVVVEMRPDAVLEIGPGSALSRMLVELEPRLPVRAVDEFRSLGAALAWVRSRGAGADNA